MISIKLTFKLTLFSFRFTLFLLFAYMLFLDSLLHFLDFSSDSFFFALFSIIYFIHPGFISIFLFN